MIKGLGSQAYTIAEVMVVLAVTAVLLVTALWFISGQQQRTEFNQAITDIRRQIDDLIGNVATGYYSNAGDFPCTPTSAGPNFTGAASGQGTHAGCILAGRAMQFNVNGDPVDFNIYNLAGLQYRGGGTTGVDVSSLSEARPVAMSTNIENKHLAYGLRAEQPRYNTSSNMGAFAIVTDFARQGASGISSNSRSAEMWVIDNNDLSYQPNNSEATALAAMDSKNGYNYIGPVDNIVLCFESTGTDQHGVITIGTNARQLTTELLIDNGNCP